MMEMKQPSTATSQLPAPERAFATSACEYIVVLSAKVSDLESTIESLQKEMETKEQHIKDLQQENKELKEKLRQQEEENQRLRKEKTQQDTDDHEGLYLAKFKGAIIILLYILYAITRLKKPLLLTHSGTPATFKEVTAFFSKALHVDLKNASQRISSALVESDNLDNHLAVFKEMMEIITDRYNRR